MKKNEQSMAMAKRQSQAVKTRRKIVYAILSIMLLAVIAVAVSVKVLVVRSIKVDGVSLYEADEIIRESGIKKGKSLASLDVSDAEKRLVAGFPFVEQASVTRKLPDRVEISITENKGPISIEVAGEKFALSDDLIVMSRIPSDDAVHRVGLKNDDVKRCVVGEKLEYNDSDLDLMTPLMFEAIKQLGVVDKVDYIDLTDKFHIRLKYDGRFVVRLGNHKDLQFKTKLFTKVAEKLGPEDRGEIDVTDIKAAYVKLSGEI